jgi:hypothetical protein
VTGAQATTHQTFLLAGMLSHKEFFAQLYGDTDIVQPRQRRPYQ